MPARPVHFEIHATDPAKIVAFYTAVFGWTIAPWGPPGTYWTVTTGKDGPGIDGGIVPRRGPAPAPDAPVSSAVLTHDVPDLDATATAVAAHGGAVALPKMPVPTIGWLMYFRDPDGNLFGALQADAAAR